MIEEQVREAIIAELKRQAAARSADLSVEERREHLLVNGEIELDELVMAILGSIAGGP